MDSFANFLMDMGLKPTGKETLERIDNSKGYEPGNCKWIELPLQAKNKRTNKPLTFNGQTKLISEWAKSMRMVPAALSWRLKHGWTLEKALTQPNRQL